MDGRPVRWSAPTVVLHWLGAALILELLGHGWLMVHGGLSAATTFDLFQSHKSIGFVALGATVLRLAARALFDAPPELSAAVWERRLAKFVQGLLYLLTLAAIGSGWLLVSTSPLPIPTQFFGWFVVPAIAGPNPSLFAVAARAHALCAATIAGLVILHVAGALKHRWLDRDDALERIWIRYRRLHRRPPQDDRTGRPDEGIPES